ncbi:hypothetical protein HDU99_005468 [Rhizoclosmatium hyalinum]|nr:hypothetical protein HDU99_005468 [Rhizoclosmatium hyalinum]
MSVFRSEASALLQTPHEHTLHNSLVLAVLANAASPASATASNAPNQQAHALLISRSLKRSLAPLAHQKLVLPQKQKDPLAQTASANTGASSRKDADKKAKRARRKLDKLRTIQALEDQARAAIKAVQDNAKRLDDAAIPLRFQLPDPEALLPSTLTPEIQARIQMLQTCRQSASLPSIDTLKSRMQVIAALNGVEIDPDCVSFMEQALSTYLKDIIASVQERVRQNHLESLAVTANQSKQSGPATPAKRTASEAFDHHDSGMMGGGSGMGGEAANLRLLQGGGILTTEDMILSSEITPILLKRCPGSVDTIELLLSSK